MRIGLPFALFNLNLDGIFLSRFRVVRLVFVVRFQLLGHFPKLFGPQFEGGVRLCLVPKDLVGQLVTFGIVVNDQALKVFRALVHHLAEALKRRKHARVVFINALAIVDVGLP